MWNRGGRNSALDRAQALLTARRSGPRDAGGSGGSGGSGATQRPEDTTRTHQAIRSQSSLGRGGEDGEDGGGGEDGGRGGGEDEDEGGGRGSRFLKKAPPAAPASSLSTVRNPPDSRCASSSQTAALSKLAQIESRARGEARRRTSAPPEAAVVSVQPSSDLGELTGKRFLKNKAAAGDITSIAAAAGDPGVGVRPGARAAGAGRLLSSLEMKTVVSLESDEDDMRKLLGDSLDSVDDSLIQLGIRVGTNHKVPDEPDQPDDASRPSSVMQSLSPASPSRHSSPFRFTGHVQARFSPSALSPSPSPSPRPGSARGPLAPLRTVSSMSGHSEVRSLDELFPARPRSSGSGENSSEMSSVSSEDFKINVMTLDDLAPAPVPLSERKPTNEREAKQAVLSPGSPKKGDPRQEEEAKLSYESDFESESKSEPILSVSQVSEHLHGEEDGAEALHDEASHSGASHRRTDHDDDHEYSNTFSDTRTSSSSQTSKSLGGKGDSRSSCASRSRSTSSHQQRRRAPGRKTVKEAAVQTQPDTAAYTWTQGDMTFDPSTYINPSPVAAYTLSAEKVDALSNFNPAAFVVNELLKQQLAMTKRFIESSQLLHSSLLQSLEPPNYRYTTLENTMQSIRKHRAQKLTTEEA